VLHSRLEIWLRLIDELSSLEWSLHQYRLIVKLAGSKRPSLVGHHMRPLALPGSQFTRESWHNWNGRPALLGLTLPTSPVELLQQRNRHALHCLACRCTLPCCRHSLGR